MISNKHNNSEILRTPDAFEGTITTLQSSPNTPNPIMGTNHNLTQLYGAIKLPHWQCVNNYRLKEHTIVMKHLMHTRISYFHYLYKLIRLLNE